ncbi:ATP-binding protein [Desulfobulbus sp.]|uniref:ATP-binding protein n=1 Tax=Desulfobulbus sp. TaxID=895 RepID=UPI00286EBF0B|nr:ATP-binding protein [Desulfobulbus sp.]
MYSERTLEDSIGKAAAQFPVLLLTGARQVGKTTLLRRLSGSERAYVSLDDPLVLSLAREDPALFMQRFPAPVLIDEMQHAPQLLPYIKMAADADRKTGGFWLTGSQQFQMMRNVSESLAGRVAVLQLLGLSRRESVGDGADQGPFLPSAEFLSQRARQTEALSLKELYTRIWRGSFPALALDAKLDRDLFLGSYVQTYLQRDVRDLAQVGDEMAFLRFLRASAARTGQLLNISELARDADVSPVTGKKWLSILEASGLIYLLEPYFTNVTKRMVKTPKLYFLDTGLAVYLTEWSSPETLEAGAMSGAILETWIMGELLKSWLHNGLRPPFYYYRDKDRKEIDLLIIQNGTIFPLEFKKTASPDKHDIRHFSVLEKFGMPVGMGGVICLASQALPLSSKAWNVPASLI